MSCSNQASSAYNAGRLGPLHNVIKLSDLAPSGHRVYSMTDRLWSITAPAEPREIYHLQSIHLKRKISS